MADEIFPNGVNGLTGEYLLPPLSPADVAARARQPGEDADDAKRIKRVHTGRTEPEYRLPFDVDPEVVAEAGWAIVVSDDEDAEVRAELDALVEHRRSRLGEENVKVLDYQPGERWAEWLDRHGTAPGNVDPEKVPYYVLLAGDPTRIPFSFQYLLGVEYAVGRLSFDDPGGYAGYIRGLVDYELSAPARDAAATFFGTRHKNDKATTLSADSLVVPLADSFRSEGRFGRSVSEYRVEHVVGEPATKEALTQILAGSGPSGRPALLFSATHGMGGWPAGHPDQTARHGALLCQDWPGVGQVSQKHYFAGRISPPMPASTGSWRSFSRASRPARPVRTRSRMCPARRRRCSRPSRSSPGCPRRCCRTPRAARSRSSAMSTRRGATPSSVAGSRTCCRSRTRSAGSCSGSRSRTR